MANSNTFQTRTYNELRAVQRFKRRKLFETLINYPFSFLSNFDIRVLSFLYRTPPSGKRLVKTKRAGRKAGRRENTSYGDASWLQHKG